MLTKSAWQYGGREIRIWLIEQAQRRAREQVRKDSDREVNYDRSHKR